MVAVVRAGPRASDYYAHDSEQLTLLARQYAVVASVVAHVADAFLLELLGDDRVARHVADLEATIDEEIESLQRVELFVWQRLSGLLGELGPHLLRAWCLHAGRVIRAFIHRRALSVAHAHPWRLLQGDSPASLKLWQQPSLSQSP